MSQNRGSPKGNFDLGKYIIVKLRKGKNSFEMVCDPEEAWKAKQKLTEYRNNEKKNTEITLDDIVTNSDFDFSSIFPTFDIFKNVKKGERCTEEELTESFETIEGRRIAADFVLEGEFLWTQSQRHKWVEQKKKHIITILARNCINPQSKKPHPPKRIEKAMEEAKVSINLEKTAEEQIEAVLKKIQLIIPIRMESIQMALKIPAAYAPKAYNIVEKFAQVKNSEWQTDGSWVGMISLPAGLQMEMIEKLNKLTHGRMQTKLIQN